MKRFADLLSALTASVLLLLPILITMLLVRLSSKGPILYWSSRIGRDNQLFSMPKFRSMQIGTPVLATHVMNEQSNPEQYLTPVGSFIRKTSLDELPQLWSVLKGDMSIVGPRPALFNQGDLMQMRTSAGIHKLKPGITGWAQVNGRDEIPIPKKVKLDVYYLEHQSFRLDCHIIFLTILKVIKRDNVLH